MASSKSFGRRIFRRSRVFCCVFLLIVVTCILPLEVEHWQYLPIPLEVRIIKRPSQYEESFVDTPSCKIAGMHPFDLSVMPYVTQLHTPSNCRSDALLTYVKALVEPKGQWELRVDSLVKRRHMSKNSNVSCCFSSIRRHKLSSNLSNLDFIPDLTYTQSDCNFFNERVILNPDEEFIEVHCYSTTNGNIYRNLHVVTPLKPELRKRLEERNVVQDEEKLNVLIFSFDSMSQLNLLRTMPKTVNNLKEAGFINFWGYTKVGSNTFPNAMGLLTGLSVQKAKDICWSDPEGGVDDCPFIWKDFEKEGYVTAYLEDESYLYTFNRAAGFLQQPTDFYNRPYIMACHNKLPMKLSLDDNHILCLGSKSFTDNVLDHLSYFLDSFQEFPKFVLVWLSNFSHGSLNQPKAMDQRFVSLLKEFQSLGVYNNSVVIFTSDHGPTYGSLLHTRQGWFETKMPYFYISFPEWWKTKHEQEYRNLLSNRNKLVSTFDVFVTLKDILYLTKGKRASPANESLTCPKCRSLMSSEFGDRTCDDAGIPAEYCTCSDIKDIPVNETIIEAAKFAFTKIKLILQEYTKCVNIEFVRVISAQKKVNVGIKNHEVFIITFETDPHSAKYQATVICKDKQYEIEGLVQRINKYEDTGHCIEGRILKMYCICGSDY